MVGKKLCGVHGTQVWVFFVTLQYQHVSRSFKCAQPSGNITGSYMRLFLLVAWRFVAFKPCRRSCEAHTATVVLLRFNLWLSFCLSSTSDAIKFPRLGAWRKSRPNIHCHLCGQTFLAAVVDPHMCRPTSATRLHAICQVVFAALLHTGYCSDCGQLSQSFFRDSALPSVSKANYLL